MEIQVIWRLDSLVPGRASLWSQRGPWLQQVPIKSLILLCAWAGLPAGWLCTYNHEGYKRCCQELNDGEDYQCCLDQRGSPREVFLISRFITKHPFIFLDLTIGIFAPVCSLAKKIESLADQ